MENKNKKKRLVQCYESVSNFRWRVQTFRIQTDDSGGGEVAVCNLLNVLYASR